jgi:hypothetical protein
VYKQDAVMTWTPNPAKKIVVSELDVKMWLFRMVKVIPRVQVAFDQWQSLLFIAELKEAGVEAGQYHTYDQDYNLLKKGMRLGKAKVLDDAELLNQLNALKDKKGKFVLDKAKSLRKDMVDVTVGGFKVMMAMVPESELPGYIVGSNLNDFGFTIPNRPA